MQCEEAQDLLGAVIDDDTADQRVQAARAHAGSCASCGEALADFRRLSRELRSVGREGVPATLEARVRAALATEADHSWPVIGVLHRHPLVRQVAALVLCCVLSVLITFTVMRQSGKELRLEQDVVSAHVRSLLQESPFQVASGDPHSVRPWFNGRVDYAPAVKDLGAEGFPLLGGRLDYVGGRRVSALVYKRRLHFVSVFMWPSAGPEETAPALFQISGYNLIAWSRAGLSYWAISDLNATELQQLQSLL
jgi:anti-sigma factor RsiW